MTLENYSLDYLIIKNYYVFQVLFGVLLAFLPESPIWLRSKNRFEEAELSANWLKLPSPSEIIAANPKINIKMKQNGHRNSQHSGTADQEEKVKFFSRPIILPLIIGLTLLVLQQISGIDAIIFFTVEIFKASGRSLHIQIAYNCNKLVFNEFVFMFITRRKLHQ